MLAALVSVASLAGCGGGGPDLGRGAATEVGVPVFPGAEVVERETLARRTTEEGQVVGGGMRIVFRLPGGAGPAAVARLYRRQLEPDWTLVEELDGPVLNFRRGELTLSVNLESWRTHELEVAAGHDEGHPVELVLEPSTTAEAAIAFTVNREGFGEIWLIDEDGRNRRRLTAAATPETDASGSTSPAWSPDGSLIAFASSGAAVREDQDAIEICVMAADGSRERPLTDDRVLDGMPAWSPDGRRIAFAHAPGRGTEQAAGVIVVMDAAGGNPVEVTRHERDQRPVYDLDPAWSPDGRLIAFTRVSFAAGQPRPAIYVVEPDGTGERLLLDQAADPAWSPDGTRLAFTSFRDRYGRTCFQECSPSGELYVANADGTGLRRLTETQADDRSPAWSPEGARIAFVSDRSDRNRHENEIYVMRADGSGLRRLTRNDVWDLEPAWRP